MDHDVLRPLYTYLDRIDAGDLDAVGRLFAPDGVYDILGTEHHGPDTIVRTLRSALAAWERTSHHGSNPLVAVDGDTATVSASLYAYHASGETVWHFLGPLHPAARPGRGRLVDRAHGAGRHRLRPAGGPGPVHRPPRPQAGHRAVTGMRAAWHTARPSSAGSPAARSPGPGHLPRAGWPRRGGPPRR